MTISFSVLNGSFVFYLVHIIHCINTLFLCQVSVALTSCDIGLTQNVTNTPTS